MWATHLKMVTMVNSVLNFTTIKMSHAMFLYCKVGKCLELTTFVTSSFNIEKLAPIILNIQFVNPPVCYQTYRPSSQCCLHQPYRPKPWAWPHWFWQLNSWLWQRWNEGCQLWRIFLLDIEFQVDFFFSFITLKMSFHFGFHCFW